MMRSAYKFLKKIISVVPNDLRVREIVKTLHCTISSIPPKISMNIAIQGVEDPLFFGLFAAIFGDLKEKNPIKADLLQIRSINGAVGTGLRSKIARHWIVSRLVNDQWARVNRDLVGRVAYRSQPIFWNFGRYKDRSQALKLWRQMKSLEFPDKLRSSGIQIGDLVIDSYLRFRPSPRFDVCDPFVLTILQQAVRDLELASNYFSSSRPRLYLSSYSTYIEHGIPVRVAVSMGIPVRVYGNLISFGKRLCVDDTYHTADTSQYKSKFEMLTAVEQDVALSLAESHLKRRLSGGIDAATSYMKASAYARSGEVAPDVAGSVVIFLHDFYDSPHVYHDLIFPDFWAWICFTIQTLSEAGISFWLKPHPNQISLSEGVLVELQQRFPQARFISSGVTNVELVEAGMVCGVTVYGTVAHELAYLGLPSITCARHPHASFAFCRTALDVDQYRQMLQFPTVLPLSRDGMRREALAFYYMHNLNGTANERELKDAFVHFWKTCNTTAINPIEVASALLKLRSLPGWRVHLEEIQKDIDCHDK